MEGVVLDGRERMRSQGYLRLGFTDVGNSHGTGYQQKFKASPLHLGPI